MFSEPLRMPEGLHFQSASFFVYFEETKQSVSSDTFMSQGLIWIHKYVCHWKFTYKMDPGNFFMPSFICIEKYFLIALFGQG